MDGALHPDGSRVRLAASIAALILFSAFLQVGIDQGRAELDPGTTHVESTASSLLEFLGGARTAAGAYLWLKVDRINDEYLGESLAKAEELMPLYRIVTFLDPQIEEAYYVGSYLLCKFKKPDEGWRFALEGLEQNPGSPKMELNVGQIALFYRNDYATAAKHLEKAVSLATSDEDLTIALQNLEAAYRRMGLTNKAEAIKRSLSKAPNEAVK